MAFEVVMPRLGWNMEEGALAGWRKSEGDTVTAGEILFEVESDKAIQECEALENGILYIPPECPPKGKAVPVGTLLAYLLAPGEAKPKPAAGAPAPAAATATPAAVPVVAPDAVAAAPAVVAVPRPAASRAAQRPAAPTGRHAAISPRAKRVAGELGVRWEGLSGSGRTGRIVERDVQQAARTGAPVAGTGMSAAASVSGPRRLIAQRMAASAQATAAVTLTTEADATEMVRLRAMFKKEGAPVVPTYNDMLILIAALALQEHPACNARLEGDEIVRPDEVNVGLAVDTDRGLLVPVVKSVQGKTLRQIAEISARLVEATRAGRVTPEDLHGGTFTITNLGAYDIDAFTPIINLPECAILGVGRIVARQVVTDPDAGAVAIRRMVVLSLTFDHRLVDGAPAARFLQTLKSHVEKPYSWLAGT